MEPQKTHKTQPPQKGPDKTPWPGGDTHVEEEQLLLATMLRFANPAFLKHCQFRPVKNVAEYKIASQLVYRDYMESGSPLSDQTRTRLSMFQSTTKATTYIAIYKEETILGTLTVVHDSPVGLPMDSIFKTELDGLRRDGRKLVEFTLLALNPRILANAGVVEETKFLIYYRLFKAALSATWNTTNMDAVVGCSHPGRNEMMKLYQAQQLGPVKHMPGSAIPTAGSFLDVRYLENKASESLKTFFGIRGKRQGPPVDENSFIVKFKDFVEIFRHLSTHFGGKA